MIIAIEGVDGSGKNTQTKKLVDYLNNHHGLARGISFPRDDGPAGVAIRSFLDGRYEIKQHVADAQVDPLAEAKVLQALMLADRMAAAALLREDKYVTVCDRYIYSGIVYGSVDGLDEGWLHGMQSLLPQADIQILLDANPEVAKERRPVMRDRYEKDFAKLHKIREKYLTIWKRRAAKADGQWYIVDATASPEAVHAAIVKCYLDAIQIRDIWSGEYRD